MVGTFAYVADNLSGLRVIDVSNPALPSEVGSIDTPGTARSVSVVGGLAYVADGAEGFRVIDVSNPAVPVEIASIDTPSLANGVSVVGDLAYVADTVSGLRVIQAVPEPRAFWLQLAAGAVVFAIHGFSTRRRTVVN